MGAADVDAAAEEVEVVRWTVDDIAAGFADNEDTRFQRGQMPWREDQERVSWRGRELRIALSIRILGDAKQKRETTGEGRTWSEL